MGDDTPTSSPTGVQQGGERRKSFGGIGNALVNLHRNHPISGGTTEGSTDTSSPKEVDGGVWHVLHTGFYDTATATATETETAEWCVHPGDTAVPIVLHSLVGRGSYGKVYKGMCNNKLVAVKVIPHNISAIDKITREVKVMMSLEHPNIIRAIAYVCWERLDAHGKLDDEDVAAQTWIVQEYCDSGNLSQVIKDGRLDELQGRDRRMLVVIDILEEIAMALHYMHSRRVLHGDLKCSNVLMMSKTGKIMIAKVGDFGLSRTLMDDTHLNTTTLGTISHMSPEMLRCGHMSYMADMYAFGMIMYEMLTGIKPYQGMMQSMVIEKVLIAGEMPAVPKDMSPRYVAVMRRCWKYIAKERPTFGDMLVYLRELRHDNMVRTSAEWESSLAA